MSVLETKDQISPMKTDILVFTKTSRRSSVDCAKQRRRGVAIIIIIIIIITTTKGNMYVNRRCNLRRQKCD